ncbi:Reverse transcriptase Ty1/copia-type domain-containing protein [Abeliophyllum distichum]|uniref:Reverse transcriptase Ty1/copia-type domain-containing protein n=1 Tax=Abeliophyllum distichum TaxID=126358 RepID=A0ABD1VZE5_9LAMI
MRQIRPNPKYQSFNLTEYALVSGKAIDCHEPFTYEEAVSCPKSKEWKEAMRDEMLSLMKNETWKLVPCPPKQRIIQSTKFGMRDAKCVNVPLAGHMSISSAQSPKNQEEINEMEHIPYANAIGSVMYSMITTRLDLAYSISLLSRFISNPGKPHWAGLKWLLRHICGTLSTGLVYEKSDDMISLTGYVDSDFAGDRDQRKSTTAFFFTLAITDAVKEGLWLKGLLNELNISNNVVSLFIDSQSALMLCKNPVYHERSKHIEVKYHFVREQLSYGEIVLLKIPTSENPADMALGDWQPQGSDENISNNINGEHKMQPRIVALAYLLWEGLCFLCGFSAIRFHPMAEVVYVMRSIWLRNSSSFMSHLSPSKVQCWKSVAFANRIP